MGTMTAKTYRTCAVLGPLVVLCFYQACGRVGFDASKGGSANFASQGVCESQLKMVYQSTFFPLLSTSCNRCHSNAHGSTDLNTSYSGFMAKGASLVEYKATHPHGDNGINLTNQIASVKSQWNSGQDLYLACLASGGDSGEAGSKLRVNAKTVAAIEMTVTNQAQWKFVEWDLDVDVPTNMQGRYAAFLRIEARLALQSGNVVGFEFRNPTMRLKGSGQNIQVNGMNIYLNEAFQSNVTTYSGMSMIVDKMTAVALAPGASISLDWFPDANKDTTVALEFSSIQHTNQSGVSTGGGTGGANPVGSPVTFAQLISTDTNLGIFRRSCFACHSGGNLGGGLDLSDYNAAKANASGIQARMNNAANPMPKSGLLPQADRDVVSRWVNGGSPQ